MTLHLQPNAERLLSVFLRNQGEVNTLVDGRIYTELPAEPRQAWPAVRITRFGGAPEGAQPAYMDHPLLQVDCFGGPKATALQLAETCRAVIDARIAGVHDEGVVTGADFGSLSYIPDDSFAEPRPRYLFTVTLHTHPSYDLGS